MIRKVKNISFNVTLLLLFICAIVTDKYPNLVWPLLGLAILVIIAEIFFLAIISKGDDDEK